jgi:hypothetical protein
MASDRLVTHQHILKAVIELERRGMNQVLSELEKLEPDLTEFVLESLTRLYHHLTGKGLIGTDARKLLRQSRKIVLVSIIALRHAQRELWDDDEGPVPPPDSSSPSTPS